jgi:RNA polymerase sigma factor (sigma-70 family)
MANALNGIVLRQIDRLYREGTLAGLGDGQLLERYLSRRDEAAFEALVDLHGPMVLGLCRRMLRDPRDVEDAFQATFLILVRKASSIRDPSHLSNWLYGVAYRVSVRARANTIRRRDRETTVASLDAATTPETMELLELGPVLDQELNRLPRKYRAALVLCYLKARTHDQAAEELHCPVGTVRSRLARGRDLLKRRLTQRGHAPTAAFLTGGPSLPAQFLSEAVPPSLASATARAALGFNSLKTIPGGVAAASALALTQGVLTTMKIAQLKWIALIVCATALSAGGVVAVSFAQAQASRGSTDSNPFAVNVAASPAPGQELKKELPRPVSSPEAIEARLKALESRLDQVLSRPNTNTPLAAGIAIDGNDPFRPAPQSDRFDLKSRGSKETTNQSIRELEAELKIALIEYDGTANLVKRNAVSKQELDLARGKVLLRLARLEGLLDEIADEHALLSLEMRRKRAEQQRADAQRELALSVVARNHRLKERTPEAIDELSVAKAEAELKISDVDTQVKRIEIAEVELRLDRLKRHQSRIKEIIKLADRVKDALGEQHPQSAPATEGVVGP